MRTPASSSPRHVPASGMVVLLDSLAEIGGDVPGALKASGLALLERAAREGRAALIPRAAFARLAADCVMTLHTESCRKHGLTPFPVRNHRILLMAMLGCSTLREAVGIVTDFYAMLGERSARWTVTRHGAAVTFALDRRTREKSLAELLISLFSLASYHRILGWATGRELPLLDVTLAYPDLLEETGLEDMVGIRPRFDRPQDSFSFPGHCLDWPIVRKPAQIDDLFELFPFDLLPPDYGSDTLAHRVTNAMRASLSIGEGIPGIRTMAQMFGLTAATLRRRLAREGASLVGLRSHCRRDLALTMLAGTDFTVRDIASRLHYADAATFRRAFLGWTGLTPSAWRAAHASPESAPGAAAGGFSAPRA